MSGYIGTQPVPQATQTRDSFTATSGQTSFATGGYTPNFLDVYLNGVKLAAADYTATNGSDVVLTSGAATGDILEVVAFTTFNSASSSIDDNGNATALTIDSNENVLANTTSTSVIGNGGFAIKPQTGNGTRVDISNAGEAMLLDGSASGPIVAFYGGGTAVGSIGVEGADLTIGTGTNSGLQFFDGGSSVRPFNMASNSRVDNAIDLGESNTRFKDAYLSGGVYLGGTGAANKLDDYEEGTFTPVVAGGTSAGTASYFTQSGSYTKVGNLVTVWIRLNYTSGNGSGSLQVKGFPFTVVTTNIPTFVVYTVGITASSTALPAGFCNLSNGIQLVENQTGGNSGPTLAYDGSGEIIITGTYPTND